MDATTTLETVGTWPVADQLDLVFRLWDQIVDAGWRPAPSPELLGELRQRVAAYEADPSRVLTWDQVQAHVKRPR